MNDLRRGYVAHARDLEHAVSGVLTSGWYVHGPQHAGFEAEFAHFVGSRHCLGVGNGTEALEIAVRALDLPPGSEVVSVANAGMYAATAIRRAGLTVRFADVDAETLLLNAETLAAVLQPTVRAVVVTHLYGRLADLDPIMALCREHGLAVIKDCAQAVGAHGPIGAAGSIGDLAAFSFYPTKNLGALGDGGAVTTNDDRLAERVKALRQYGWTAKYTVEIEGGGNSRLDELQAAVLRVRLPHVAEWNRKRRGIITAYVRSAAGTPVRVLEAGDESHAAHLAVALVDNRDAVREHLHSQGIRTDVHYPIPDHRQPILQSAYGSISLPITEATAGQILSLPCFPELTDDEVGRVCAALASL
jgi:dTDP-4-amino-4,6-dideoxygalactose transaminase